ncbi:CpsD/CapB family tyrosine-protein kinase, partial [Desulfococcus sp.]
EVLDQMKNDDEQYPYLNGLIDANIQATHQPGLFLLSSGVIPPNPSELLSSPQVDFLMTLLTRKFDTIIIDTPPILPATDALLLAPRTDGVVLIVKAGHMRRNLVQKCVDQIRLSQANLVGVVLNQVDVRKEGYYNYYNKYYTGYYGKS